MRAQRFEIAFPEEALSDLHGRLARSRWPETPTAGSWDEGTAVPAMRELAQAWQEDDWRAHEAAMNAYEHHRAELDGQPVHFLHVGRAGELPLLLLHGWPSTHWDFARLIPHLDGLELVIPDLPGFGFSPLVRTGIGYLETAGLMHALMTGVLGHERYAVYGFDWGALVAEQLAHEHEDAVVALHVSMPFPLDFAPPAPELWAPEEQEFAERTAHWAQEGFAYFQLQATRPQTLAYLTDSPAALGAWIVEKIHRLERPRRRPRERIPACSAPGDALPRTGSRARSAPPRASTPRACGVRGCPPTAAGPSCACPRGSQRSRRRTARCRAGSWRTTSTCVATRGCRGAATSRRSSSRRRWPPSCTPSSGRSQSPSGAERAAATKARTRSGTFRCSASSTLEMTSTACGRTVSIAPATFSGVNPPARTRGAPSAAATSRASVQSTGMPVPAARPRGLRVEQDRVRARVEEAARSAQQLGGRRCLARGDSDRLDDPRPGAGQRPP